jgi:hypothetical protein
VVEPDANRKPLYEAFEYLGKSREADGLGSSELMNIMEHAAELDSEANQHVILKNVNNECKITSIEMFDTPNHYSLNPWVTEGQLAYFTVILNQA